MVQAIEGRLGRLRRLRPLCTYPLRLGPAPDRFSLTAFGRLAVVHACSSASDTLVTVALAGSVFVSVSLHAARHRTALGLLCTVLPFLIVGPFLGPLIDRVRGGRRAIIVASALGRAAACELMALWIHQLWLFPAAFASLVCSKTYLVAKASLVPAVVSRQDDLVEANAKLAVGSSIVTSLAALVGAGLYREFGSELVLHVDIVLLLVCAWRASRLPPHAVDRFGRGPATADLTNPTLEMIAPHPPLLPVGALPYTAVMMAAMRGMAGLMAALVVFAFRHDGAPLIWYGLVGVASVAGNLGGATMAPIVRAYAHERQLMVACSVMIGVAALFATQVTFEFYWPAALLLGFAVGLGSSVAKLAFDALVQRDVPRAARSRVFARYEATFQLAWVVAALLPTLVVMSLVAGFLVVAGSTLGATVLYLWGYARARRGAGAWPGAAVAPWPAPPGPGS